MLEKLLADKSLERFRLEYEKLHRALRKSHESEKRLMSKCRELNAEIVANAAKVATALKLSEEDQATISSLRKEIEKAWKMLDAAQERENKSKETIAALKQEIANLTKLVEQGAGLSAGQENKYPLSPTFHILFIPMERTNIYSFYSGAIGMLGSVCPGSLGILNVLLSARHFSKMVNEPLNLYTYNIYICF